MQEFRAGLDESQWADATVLKQALNQASEAADVSKKRDVGHWVDIVAALIPAEVLTLHAFIMSLASSTSSSGKSAPVVHIFNPEIVRPLFWVLVILAAFLFLATAGFGQLQNWLRAGLVACAFVCWTMLQQGTAFDSLGLDFEPEWLRIVLAAIGAVLIAALVNMLAGKADSARPE